MKCPFCSFADSKVVDSRPDKGGATIRRRRECESCGRRFTTHERVEEILPLVMKKDGRREQFDRLKIIAGIQKACEKRPVSVDTIERLVDRLELRLQEGGEKEVPTTMIGEWVMNELHSIDQVAYVRFASVYRQFRDVSQFMDAVQQFLEPSQAKPPRDKGK